MKIIDTAVRHYDGLYGPGSGPRVWRLRICGLVVFKWTLS